MVALTDGKPLSAEELKATANIIQERGTNQFISRYLTVKKTEATAETWGDEIEFSLYYRDPTAKTVQVLLKADALFQQLEQCSSVVGDWQPEFANFMIEGVPKDPYDGLQGCALTVEANMRARRKFIQDNLLHSNEFILSISQFAMNGCPNFTFPTTTITDPRTSITHSVFYPEAAVFPHQLFKTATKVMYGRRLPLKPYSLVPIFQDIRTPQPFIDDFDGRRDGFLKDSATSLSRPGFVLLDGGAFGPSCCSLQTTFQCESEFAARNLYDNMCALAPLFLALTAATPIFRGHLCDWDARWPLFRDALDDRTDEERGAVPLRQDVTRIYGSRAGCENMLLHPKHEHLNDIKIHTNRQSKCMLLDVGVDEQMATFIANRFVRKPSCLLWEAFDQCDGNSTEIFDSVYLQHFTTVRIKLPPGDCSSGWKVEFRPMELQPTDFENAAFAVVSFLMSRLIMEENVDFCIPMSLIVQNMDASYRQNAIQKELFYYHVSVDGDNNVSMKTLAEMLIDKKFPQKSIRDIFCCPERGIVRLLREYVSNNVSDAHHIDKINQYIDFVEARANGTEPTVANKIRQFITTHPMYLHDSRVCPETVYDMMEQFYIQKL